MLAPDRKLWLFPFRGWFHFVVTARQILIANREEGSFLSDFLLRVLSRALRSLRRPTTKASLKAVSYSVKSVRANNRLLDSGLADPHADL